MNQPFAEIDLIAEITEDGSPTLRLKAGTNESMHHFAGAASETWFVYGSVVQKAVCVAARASVPSLSIASVGLGLGYIEMAISLVQQNESQKINIKLDSFETVELLKNNFVSWLNLQKNTSTPTYDLALNRLSQISNLSKTVQTHLVRQMGLGFFKMHGTIEDNCANKKWNIICYDAYSKKTNANLWNENYLNKFLQNQTETDCVFTTYAATTNLKSVLQKNNFHLIERKGFSGKRECTLAIRGLFKDGSEISQTF